MAALATLFTMTGTPFPAVAVDSTAAITGEVLSFMDPLGSARITVFNADTGAAIKSVVADGSGRYRVSGLPAGRVQVRATKAGYLTSWANNAPSRATAAIYTLSPGQVLEQSWDPMVLYLDLAPEGVVTGTVVGVSDTPYPGTVTPLAGASVTVGSVRSVTDASGKFRVGMLSAGQVTVKASAGGYLTGLAPNNPFGEVQTFSVMAGATTDIGWLRLWAPATLYGYVLSNFDPIPGTANVTVFNADTGKAIRSVVTESGGQFRIDNLPPIAVKLRATKDGYLTARLGPLDLRPGEVLGPSMEEGAVLLELKPAGIVTGSVCSIEFIDYLGVVSPCVPQGGVRVTVVAADTGTVLASGVTQDITGAFRIGGLSEGKVQVKAELPGWLSSWAPDKRYRSEGMVFDIHTANPTDVGTMTLYEPATAYVDVLWNMEPLEGTATLTLYDATTNKAVRTVQTAYGGAATRFGDLRPGTYKVRAVADGYLPLWSRLFTLLPGQVIGPDWRDGCVVLEFQLEGVITGSVMGFGQDQDDPVPGAKVVAVDAETGRVLGSAVTSGEIGSYGDFRIAGLPHTKVRLKVTAPTYLTSWAPGRRFAAEADLYTVDPQLYFGESTDVGVVAIYRPGTIAGQVLSSMDPVGSVKVTVFNADTGAAIRSVTTDAEGRYRVENLWTGPSVRVKVRASKDGYLTNWADSYTQQTMATATIFELGPGEVLEQTWSGTPSLYLDIAQEAVVEGQVLGNFDPLGGASVTVFDAATGKALKSVVADAAGNYRITGLNAWGGRTIKVGASKAGWRTSWANGKWTWGTADTFQLYPGTVLRQSWDPNVLYLDLQLLS